MICPDFRDILDTHRCQIEALEQVGNQYSNPQQPDACAAFEREVRHVESVVVSTYRLAVSSARKTPSLEDTAQVWSEVSRFCGTALQVLSGLKEKFPWCGTPALYDLVLDYKRAADKRHQQLAEEMACAKTPLPAGLFPEPS